MGYRHIENLYRPRAQTILLFRECYALEKIHGTSAHVAWRDGRGHEQAVAFAKGVEEAGGYVLGLFHQCRQLDVYDGALASWKEPGT